MWDLEFSMQREKRDSKHQTVWVVSIATRFAGTKPFYMQPDIHRKGNNFTIWRCDAVKVLWSWISFATQRRVNQMV